MSDQKLPLRPRVDIPYLNKLADLWQKIGSCKSCHLAQEAGQPTPFTGYGQSGLLIVLRNPGVDERDVGIPAVGKIAKPIDELLESLGLTRQQALITNLVNCYTCVPKPNRSPTKSEIQTCAKEHLIPLWAHLIPRLTIFMGKESFIWGRKVFCGQDETTVRGRSGLLFQASTCGIVDRYILGTEHPAVHTCYDPRMTSVWEKDCRVIRRVWNDLKAGKDPLVTSYPVFSSDPAKPVA